jgi:hypothetical protein
MLAGLRDAKLLADRRELQTASCSCRDDGSGIVSRIDV